MENGGLGEKQRYEKKNQNQLVPPLSLAIPPKSPSDPEQMSITSLMRQSSRSSLVSTLEAVKDKLSAPDSGKKKKKDENSKLRIVVAFLFVVCFSAVVTCHVLYHKLKQEERIYSNVRFEEKKRHLLLFNTSDSLVLTGELGRKLDESLHPYHCIPGKSNSTDEEEIHTKCVEWKKTARLVISEVQMENQSPLCYQVVWKSLSTKATPLLDCWPIGPDAGHWYGGGESLEAKYPLEEGRVRLSPFVTGDEEQTEWGNSIRKYFINSRGLSITVSDDTPLSVSINDDGLENRLCLQAAYDDFPYYYHRFSLPVLNYTICIGNDIKEVHASQLETGFWNRHTDSDLQELYHLIQLPLWQVPIPEDGEGYSISSIEHYVQDLLGRKQVIPSTAERGYLLLDHHWQEHMGDFKFSKSSFQNLTHLTSLLKDAGLKLALTINPFVSVESPHFKEGVKKGLFVMERNTTQDKNIPALTWFKDSPVTALLDITNPSTVSWLKDKLGSITSDAVFFLDTGNTFHTPHYFTFHKPLYNPDLYKEYFIKETMKEIKVIGVSGASSKRPKAPAFVWLTPLESSWESLQSILPNLLNLGVIGYPFVNPGPIGGYSAKEKPDLELFIRWWQLSSFLPGMHFLTPPSLYRAEGIGEVAESLKLLREEVVNPLLSRVGQEAMESSLPVVRPLWMLNPEDETSKRLEDQVLIGGELMVAPILKKGQRKRDVYLPPSKNGSGVWKRNDGTWFKGGEWVRDNPVELNQVLYFVRQPDHRRPGHLEDGL